MRKVSLRVAFRLVSYSAFSFQFLAIAGKVGGATALPAPMVVTPQNNEGCWKFKGWVVTCEKEQMDDYIKCENM